MPTQKELIDLFDYRNGKLFWKEENTEAGYTNNKGYTKIKIKDKSFFAHRLIFTFFTGLSPEIVDHIDRNPLNNKIENLRLATRQQNNSNACIRKDNTSGVKGVSWHKQQCKWNVRIGLQNKRINLGSFDDLELAELVAEMGREKYHGAFACNGIY